MTDIVKEIASKSAELPTELQNEVLDFVDFVSVKGRRRTFAAASTARLRGMLKRDLSNFEDELEQVRGEMWGSFPRDNK